MKSNKDFKILITATASALISSFAFLVNHLLSKLSDSAAISIITSLEFWCFLVLEIVLLLKLRKAFEVNNSGKEEVKDFKLWLGFLIAFIISFILLILITIINKGFETTFGMILLSLCLFSFQMIFITKSKFFKKIISERKDCER